MVTAEMTLKKYPDAMGVRVVLEKNLKDFKEVSGNPGKKQSWVSVAHLYLP